MLFDMLQLPPSRSNDAEEEEEEEEEKRRAPRWLHLAGRCQSPDDNVPESSSSTVVNRRLTRQ